MKLNKVQFSSVSLIVCSLLYFVYSLVILDAYTLGDRQVYGGLYDQIQNLNFMEALNSYFLTLGAVDVGWFFIYFPLSKVIDSFDVAQAVMSTLLFWQAGKFFKGRCSNTRLYIIYMNCFVNIQFLALSFSSLRLAIAFFFIFIAANNERYTRYFFSIASIISHITIVLLMFLSRSRRLGLMLWLIVVVSSLAVLFTFWGVIGVHLLGKIDAYSSGYADKLTLFNILKLALLVVLLVVGAGEKKLIYVLSIIIVYLVVPDPRVYQLLYFVVYLRLMLDRSRYSFFALITLSLLGIPNGLLYILGVFERGNGLDPTNF
jgi:hypothetical protein